MKIRIVMSFVATIVVALFSVQAYALPPESLSFTYYDEEMNVIGTSTLACNGQRTFDGATSDIYTVDLITECYSMQPLTCADRNLESMPGMSSDSTCSSSTYQAVFCDYYHMC